MKSSYRVAALLLLLAPSHAYLATGSDLISNVSTWEELQKLQFEEESIDTVTMQREMSSELFPEEASSSSAGTIDQTRDERTSDFLSVTVGGETIVFSDVRRDAWYAPYVREIAELNIVSGYRDANGEPLGKFGPADNVTVEQMAKVVLGASGTLNTCTGSGVINPLAKGTWSEEYIKCTENLGWTLYADGTVDIARNATRIEVVSTILQAYKINPQQPTTSSFTDVPVTMQFAASIEQAKLDGIVSGYNDENGIPTGLFGPNDPVTRAEFAKMVTLAIQVYGDRE
jgi:hypothetical protein